MSLLSAKPINWKTNLAAVWVAQFLALSAFYFCIPFLPLYLKEKRIVPDDETAFWSGVFISAAPVAMMIMSPIWGALGDRYGRKMMLVRSTLSAAFVLYLMGVVDSIEALIVLRILQGVFTGTIPVAQTLVSVSTPHRHHGLALGLMMAAINAAYTAGAYFGGLFAMHYGAGNTFKVGGYLQIFATIIVLLVVRENFTPPLPRARPNTRSARLRGRKEAILNFSSGIPALLGIAFLAVLVTYDGPFLALYIEQLYNAGGVAEGAAVAGEVFKTTGSVNALASIIAVGGSLAIGMLTDRNAPRWVWPAIALASAGGVWWIYADASLFGLAFGRSVSMFFLSGLASVLVVILSRMTPASRKGTALGWTVTARCVGWAAAPLIGALIAGRWGYSNAFAALAIFSLMLVPFFMYLTRRYPGAFGSGGEEEAVPD